MARRSRPRQRPSAPDPPDRLRNAAAYMTTTRPLPRTLIAGRRYDVALTMRNIGTTVWRAEGDQPHRLGPQHPRDNTVWGIGRIDVPDAVAPGAETTFAFAVVAPKAPGRYHFQWRMVQDGVGWFGESTQDVVVQVTHPTGAEQRHLDPQIALHRSEPPPHRVSSPRRPRVDRGTATRQRRPGPSHPGVRWR